MCASRSWRADTERRTDSASSPALPGCRVALARIHLNTRSLCGPGGRPPPVNGSCEALTLERRSKSGSLVVSDRGDPHALAEIGKGVRGVEVIDPSSLLVG